MNVLETPQHNLSFICHCEELTSNNYTVRIKNTISLTGNVHFGNRQFATIKKIYT